MHRSSAGRASPGLGLGGLWDSDDGAGLMSPLSPGDSPSDAPPRVTLTLGGLSFQKGDGGVGMHGGLCGAALAQHTKDAQHSHGGGPANAAGGADREAERPQPGAAASSAASLRAAPEAQGMEVPHAGSGRGSGGASPEKGRGHAFEHTLDMMPGGPGAGPAAGRPLPSSAPSAAAWHAMGDVRFASQHLDAVSDPLDLHFGPAHGHGRHGGFSAFDGGAAAAAGGGGGRPLGLEEQELGCGSPFGGIFDSEPDADDLDAGLAMFSSCASQPLPEGHAPHGTGPASALRRQPPPPQARGGDRRASAPSAQHPRAHPAWHGSGSAGGHAGDDRAEDITAAGSWAARQPIHAARRPALGGGVGDGKPLAAVAAQRGARLSGGSRSGASSGGDATPRSHTDVDIPQRPRSQRLASRGFKRT